MVLIRSEERGQLLRNCSRLLLANLSRLVRERRLLYVALLVAVVLFHTVPLGSWLLQACVPIYLLFVVLTWLWDTKLVGTLTDGPGLRSSSEKDALLHRWKPGLQTKLLTFSRNHRMKLAVVRSCAMSVLLVIFIRLVQETQAAMGRQSGEDSLWLLFVLAVYPVTEEWKARLRHVLFTLGVAMGGLVAAEYRGDWWAVVAEIAHKLLWVMTLTLGHYYLVRTLGTWWLAPLCL